MLFGRRKPEKTRVLLDKRRYPLVILGWSCRGH